VAPLLLVGAECGTDLTAPQNDGLAIEVATTSEVIGMGQTGAIIIRLRNLRPQPVTLTFNSGCQLNVFIRRVGGGQVFPPPPNGHGCFAAITTLSLDAFEEHSESFLITGGNPDWELARADVVAGIAYIGLPLLPGRYAARAELGDNFAGTMLRSLEVKFEIRD
jgi:hypothetical protein